MKKYEQNIVPIIVAQSTVLSNLLRTETIADTQVRADDDVRYGWICLRIAIAEVCESLAENNVLNGSLLAILIEVSNGLFRIILIL